MSGPKISARAAPARRHAVVAGVAFLVLPLLLLGVLTTLGVASSLPAPALAASTNSAGSVAAENSVLGYGLRLPDGYRRSRSLVVPGTGVFVGRDTYTVLNATEERAICLEDNSGTPSPSAAKNLDVEVYLNPGNVPALAWANRAPQQSPRTTIQGVAIGALDAARFIEDGKSVAYAIRANDRIYLLTPVVWPSLHPLDDIAATFSAITASPRPAISPGPAPRDVAVQVGAQLAGAFAARDVEAVARLMNPCVLSVSALIDGQPQGGVLNRSVGSFLNELRTRFASRALTVVVNPQLETLVQRDGPTRFFVRSVWTDTGRSMDVDLFLDVTLDGRSQWSYSAPHFRGADVKRGGCIPFPSPWVSGGVSC